MARLVAVCPVCPWPVYLAAVVSPKGTRACLDIDALERAIQVHLAQHGISDDED
ncbi:hypothetical protein [Parafrankia colletiae]|uniref:hypothetical protein n=1 Tax=Parafrankia colletiae TaxID=573497 RepID=UPI0012FFC155|nr:hypothetical protein [Parafrankia colletiae]